MSVALRVDGGYTVWLLQGTDGRRPNCERWWPCKTCNIHSNIVSRRPRFVVQIPTADPEGWKNWYITDLEVDIISVTPQELQQRSSRELLSDCPALR